MAESTLTLADWLLVDWLRDKARQRTAIDADDGVSNDAGQAVRVQLADLVGRLSDHEAVALLRVVAEMVAGRGEG